MSKSNWQNGWTSLSGNRVGRVTALPSTDRVQRRSPLPAFLEAIAQALILPIRAYQMLVSPWLGAHCRFHPSCSSYAIEALRRHGPLHGLGLALRRVFRCHPYCEGGYDPVQ